MKKTILIVLTVLLTVLIGCSRTPEPAPTTPTIPATEVTGETPTETVPASGWIDGRYYLENGAPAAGWTELSGKRYYFNSDGSPFTGWLELDGNTYYIFADGSAATGMVTIEGKTCYFTSTGAQIILVNPWNYIPDDYEVELVTLDDGHQVAAEMYEPLMQMLSDCQTAGHRTYLRSAYRTHAQQQDLFRNKVARCGGDEARAAMEVAVPGTSEHQLGLAVDIVDDSYRALDTEQENTETQKWLIEHCWEYGFILRYPNDKSDATGIIYEPWHYRYVGKELALELRNSGLCLEEYLLLLTEGE